MKDYSEVTATLQRDITELNDYLRREQYAKALKQAWHIIYGLVDLVRWLDERSKNA